MQPSTLISPRGCARAEFLKNSSCSRYRRMPIPHGRVSARIAQKSSCRPARTLRSPWLRPTATRRSAAKATARARSSSATICWRVRAFLPQFELERLLCDVGAQAGKVRVHARIDESPTFLGCIELRVSGVLHLHFPHVIERQALREANCRAHDGVVRDD